jgi:hypothetical protein
LVAAAAALLLAVVAAAGTSPIASVEVSRPFFNPTIGQKIEVAVALAQPGKLSIAILDRDGYLVRRLVTDAAAERETQHYEWNGRDDAGEIVPDEAYSLKIDFTGADGSSATYFPAREPAREVGVTISGYDRLTGVFSYKLAAPARVHVQAGTSEVDPKTQNRDGPVLKTLANREPRPLGAVVENWDGFDETGSIYVPDLRGFAYAVAATSLPENALLVSGGEPAGFLKRAASRSGSSLLPPTPAASHAAHHHGLSALEDASPALNVRLDGTQHAGTKGAVVAASGNRVSGSVFLDGPSSAAFAAQPGDLVIFVDGKRVKEIAKPAPGVRFEVSLAGLAPGEHVVAVNWVSKYGPVAVSSVRVGTAAQFPSKGGESPASTGGAR